MSRNTYRKHELMLPDGFDPVALLAAVHLEEDRVHAQEQRELQEKQAQQESVQSRRQAIANAVTQARSVSMPDYVLNTPRSERFSRPLRSTPDPLPVMRDAVVFPENMQNLSLDEIPPSFDQEVCLVNSHIHTILFYNVF